MSHKPKDESAIILTDLSEQCGPLIRELMKDDRRHDREWLAGQLVPSIERSELLRQHLDLLNARQVVEHYVNAACE